MVLALLYMRCLFCIVIKCNVFYHLSCLLIAEFIFAAYFVGGHCLVYMYYMLTYKWAGNNRRCCGIARYKYLIEVEIDVIEVDIAAELAIWRRR